MDRDLRIFNRHLAHSTPERLHTIPFQRQSRCAFPTPAFTLWNPISGCASDSFTNFAPFFAKSENESARRGALARLHPRIAALRVDTKNDIFTWTFVKRKERGRGGGGGEKATRRKERTDREVKPTAGVYCMDAISIYFPLTKKKSSRPRIIPRIIVDL